MIEETHWHPVALVEALAGQLPIAVTLLDQPIVLWCDASGQVRAWADQCPHRGAKLSLGRVVDGRLQCGYHGWQFDSAGQCVRVPALPDFVPPPAQCARVFEASERYGLIWVRLRKPDAEESGSNLALPVPAFEAETDLRLRKLNCGPYDVATSAPRIVENFLDMAHFGFVHPGLLGNADTASIDDYTVEPTPTGLLATQCKAWQPRASAAAAQAAQVTYTYEVNAPYTAVLTKLASAHQAEASVLDAEQTLHDAIALFICPVAPEQSRVWFRLALADFESTDEALRNFQNTIFLQDQPVLESQSPKRLPLNPNAEAHTRADKASAAYRRHLKTLGITFGVC